MENSDETFFEIDIENAKRLGFRRDVNSKFAEMVSGVEGTTIMVHLTGSRDACTVLAFFQNHKRNYSIRGVLDDLAESCYRTEPKGGIDQIVMSQWLSETRLIRALSEGRKRILYIDSCGGHKFTDAVKSALDSISTDLLFYPKNTTS